MSGVRIKITQPGMEGFSDFLGAVEFADGISVNTVSQIEAQHLAACFSIETVDGEDPSEAALYAAIHNSEEPPVNFATAENVIISANAPPVVYNFTRESLEAIADEKGIAGVRAIAAQYGVKSNSIVGLIEELMALVGEEKG